MYVERLSAGSFTQALDRPGTRSPGHRAAQRLPAWATTTGSRVSGGTSITIVDAACGRLPVTLTNVHYDGRQLKGRVQRRAGANVANKVWVGLGWQSQPGETGSRRGPLVPGGAGRGDGTRARHVHWARPFLMPIAHEGAKGWNNNSSIADAGACASGRPPLPRRFSPSRRRPRLRAQSAPHTNRSRADGSSGAAQGQLRGRARRDSTRPAACGWCGPSTSSSYATWKLRARRSGRPRAHRRELGELPEDCHRASGGHPDVTRAGAKPYTGDVRFSRSMFHGNFTPVTLTTASRPDTGSTRWWLARTAASCSAFAGPPSASHERRPSTNRGHDEGRTFTGS